MSSKTGPDEMVDDDKPAGSKRWGELAAAWAPSWCGVALVVAAGLHRLQLHTSGYTTSPLIPLEFFLLLVVGLGVVVQPVIAIVCCWKREWRALGIGDDGDFRY